LPEQGAYKQFYIEISEIIRRYIEGRYFVQALEETSYEIRRDLKNQELPEELQQLLGEFLNLSDLVKFARYIPDHQENEKIVIQARRFIEETRIILEPAIKTDNGVPQAITEQEANK